MKKSKQQTWTSRVEEVLRATDDFMSRKMLKHRIPDINDNQLSAALLSLRGYRVVDVIVNPDGEGWWFALPTEGDARSHHIDERTPETKPRKTRAFKKASAK